MNRKFIAATLGVLLLASPVVAQASSTTLTPVQEAELERQRQRMIDINNGEIEPATAPPKAARVVNEWVQVGQGVGAGLAGAARELGIVANEFAQTPVGIITISLIVWKVAGADLIQTLVGLSWYVVGTSVWFFFYRRVWGPKEKIVEYHENGKRKSIRQVQFDPGDKDLEPYHIIGIMVIGVVWLVGLPVMFA